MANDKLAQILRLSQQLSYQFNNVNQLISKAWLELELAREMIRALISLQDELEKESMSSYPID